MFLRTTDLTGFDQRYHLPVQSFLGLSYLARQVINEGATGARRSKALEKANAAAAEYIFHDHDAAEWDLGVKSLQVIGAPVFTLHAMQPARIVSGAFLIHIRRE